VAQENVELECVGHDLPKFLKYFPQLLSMTILRRIPGSVKSEYASHFPSFLWDFNHFTTNPVLKRRVIANHNNFGTLVDRVALRPDAPRSARRTTSSVPM
jgi:hypothetical protein